MQRVIPLLPGESWDRELIGGKAWSISRMVGLGLRVPPAFVIPVTECRTYLEGGHTLDDDLWQQILEGISHLEQVTGRTFGDPANPLLVSVRSGAAVSMPGMMDTVLNLGINDSIEAGLAHLAGDPAYAQDTHARFCHQYSEIVLKAMLDPYETGSTVQEVRAAAREDTGADVPAEPSQQLRGAIEAVFDSWNSPRAKAYRRHWKIADTGGTAVTVQAMVFGNRGERSGTGVLFTRNPLDGEPTPYGEWVAHGQGDDVVGGQHAVSDISAFRTSVPDAYDELMRWAGVLEREHRDMQDIEFTVEEGRLYLLQSRSGKRAPRAALRIAVDLVDEGVISEDEAISRITPSQVNLLLMPTLDPAESARAPLTVGEPASPGVACGVGVIDPDEAERRSVAGERIVLVRPTTSPNDVHGMIAAVAVVTELGGSTSHAAVVTRALGRPSVVGVGAGVVAGLAGRMLTVDGGSGRVFEGELPLVGADVQDEPLLAKFAHWVERRCPLRVVPTAQDVAGEVFDLDAAGFGVTTDAAMADSGGPKVAPAWVEGAVQAGAVRGSLMSTPEGLSAAIRAGVRTVIAQPSLPIQLLAVQATPST